MDEYLKRQTAVKDVLNGEKISVVAKRYHRSRKWLYLWLDRHKQKPDCPFWFKDESKAPHSKPTKIHPIIEERILNVRQTLEDCNYAQTGAIAIQYEFQDRGWQIPSVWTINRTLARNHIIEKAIPHKKRKDYPELFIHSHVMDLVGPRYIKGNGRFYSVNLMDTLTHTAFVKAVRCKTGEEVLSAIVTFWRTYGMPDALQMDNELSFKGSNRYPRSFGVVVRFALWNGVSPVFIPIREPWRNGMIEKFNDTYSKRFLKRNTFTDFNHLQLEEEKFMHFHNQYHRYSTQQHKTPFEMTEMLGPFERLKENIDLNKRMPLEKGSVYFIRFIRSDLKLHLNSEVVVVDESLKYSYVVAEVNIDNQCLLIHQNDEVIQKMEFPTPVDW